MCNSCSDYGWIAVNRDGDSGRPDVQRCDACQKFPSDGHSRVALHEAWFDLECVRRQSKQKESPDQYWADEERRWTQSADSWLRSVEDWRRIGGPRSAGRMAYATAHVEHSQGMLKWAQAKGNLPMPEYPKEMFS